MSTIVSDLSSTNTAKPASGGVSAARPIISNAVTVGGGSAPRATTAQPADGAAIENKVVSGGRPAGRALSESTRKLIEGDAPAVKTAPAKAATTASPPAAAAPAPTPAAESPPAAAPSATPPAAAAAAPEAPAADEHKERLTKHNVALLAENERLKSKASRREMSKREKDLDEVERTFWDDPIKATRKLLAVVVGVDDPASKDLDEVMSDYYKSLTKAELGVALDPAVDAQMESRRTRRLMARDKRDREPAPPPPEDPDEKTAAEHSAFIESHLATKAADGKLNSDAYPGLMKFATEFHGVKPGALVLKAIREAIATGEMSADDSADHKISKAASKIESKYKSLYQALAGVFGEAKSSTAPPTADATAPKESGQSKVAPTLTNASASVAPATPPAKSDVKPKPKFKSEADRRRAIIGTHLGDS